MAGHIAKGSGTEVQPTPPFERGVSGMFAYEIDPVEGGRVPVGAHEDRPAPEPVQQAQQRLLASALYLVFT